MPTHTAVNHSVGDPKDPLNGKLLNILQARFPLVHTPFAAIGKTIGMEEGEVLLRVKLLKESRVIRQISAIFDTRMLGYQSSLVAAKVAPVRIDEAAGVVSQHPGVSHNYRRNHDYNLWFTIAVPSDSRFGLERSIEVIRRKAGLESARILPSLKLYKIGVMFDMVENNAEAERPAENSVSLKADSHTQKQQNALTEMEVRMVTALQDDLPIDSRPFQLLADRYGLDAGSMLAKGREFVEKGIMRRFAAVLHHRNAGFSENLMGVWIVPEENADEVGKRFASFKAVSHCYLRPSYNDWPYNIFTMLHGASRVSLESVMLEMSGKTGITRYSTLYSIKEYKKVRVKYFSGELYEWEAANG